MSDLTPMQRLHIAGLLGTSGHALAHLWRDYGLEYTPVHDAVEVAKLIDWTAADLTGLWEIAISLCDAMTGTDDEA